MKKLFITSVFVLVLTLSVAPASAFLGPSAGQTPGSGGGLFTVDENRNIGFGTTSATPTSTFDNVGGGTGEGHGYVFLVASTSNPGLGLRNTSLNHMYLWSVRNIGSQSRIDLYRESPALPGKILMSVDQFGFVGISAAPTSTYRLYVGQGDIGTTGSFVGAVSGAVNAGNVASGVFGSLQGNGNFAFPAALGIGTSTTSGLPTNGLYVAGPATFADYITFSGAAGYDALRLNNEDIVNVNSIAFGDPGLNEGIIFGGGAGGNVAISLIDDTLDDSVVVTGPSTLKFGIGTSTPTSALHVYSGGSAAARFGRVGANNYGFEIGGTTFGLYDYTNSVYRWRTNGADLVLNEAAGNVGIATATPAYALDVWGTGRFTGQLTVPTPTAAGSAANKSYVDSVVGGGGQSGSFTTLSVSSTSTLAVSSGNVGIGTVSPDEKLDVEGRFKITGNQTLVAGSVGPVFANVSGFGLQISTAAFGVATNAGTSPNFVVDSTGNVGIGDATPDGKLDVEGTGGTVSRVENSSTGRAQMFLYTVNDDANDVFLGTNGVAQRYSISARGSAEGTDLHIYRNNGGWSNMMTFDWATGDVGINDATPSFKLDVNGTGQFTNTVIVGTPTAAGHAATKSYVDSAVTGGTASSSVNTAACSSDATCEVNNLNVQGGDITGVDKLTVTTIDPLYNIGGTKYSTYAPSIAGGVKEEYVGSAELITYNKTLKTYEHTIDFGEINDGSALWVWRKTVDFSDDTVQVFVTPKKVPVPIAYEISGNKIIFRASAAVELSYRLIGNRFDWRSWPTLAKDQNEWTRLFIK